MQADADKPTAVDGKDDATAKTYEGDATVKTDKGDATAEIKGGDTTAKSHEGDPTADVQTGHVTAKEKFKATDAATADVSMADSQNVDVLGDSDGKGDGNAMDVDDEENDEQAEAERRRSLQHAGTEIGLLDAADTVIRAVRRSLEGQCRAVLRGRFDCVDMYFRLVYGTGLCEELCEAAGIVMRKVKMSLGGQCRAVLRGSLSVFVWFKCMLTDESAA